MFNPIAFLQSQPFPSGEGSIMGSYLRVIFILAALLCFCFVALKLMSRRIAAWRGHGATGALELIDRLAIEPKRALYVVRTGTRYLAIASSEAGIQFLAELNPADFQPPSSEPSTPPQDRSAS